MNFYSPPSSPINNSSDSDEDKRDNQGFDDDPDSYAAPPPPHLRRLVCEGEYGGAGGYDHGCNDNDDGHNDGYGVGNNYMDVDLDDVDSNNGDGADIRCHPRQAANNCSLHPYSRHPRQAAKNNSDDEDEDIGRHPRQAAKNNSDDEDEDIGRHPPQAAKNNSDDEDIRRHPPDSRLNYFDVGNGSGNYTYGRVYLQHLINALSNQTDAVHVVDGSYFESMDRRCRSSTYAFRFLSNGKHLATIYVDQPPDTLPPESCIIDPRPRQDLGRDGTICPTCHGNRSFDDDTGNAEDDDK